MAIEGPIRELGLFELFQLISFAKKTGVLVIKRTGEDTRNIFFRDGMLLYVDLGDKLDNELRKRGILGQEENFTTALKSGKIKPNQILPTYRNMAENEIYSLLKLKDGYFTFSEEEVNAPQGMELNLRIENLLMEGARRIDEITKMSSVLDPEKNIPVISEEIERKSYINLSPEEWDLISLIDGNKTIGEIVKEKGNEFNTIKTFYGLLMAGVIKMKERKSEGAKGAEKGLMRGIELIDKLWKEARYQEGIELLLRLKERFPDEPVILYNLGYFYLRTGRWGESISEFRKFLSTTKNQELKLKIEELVEMLKKIFEQEKKEGNVG